MDNLKAASYLCEDTNVNGNAYLQDIINRRAEETSDDYEGEGTLTGAELEFLESYDEKTGTVDFHKPNPDLFNKVIKVALKAGIKKFTVSSDYSISSYNLFLIYNEYDGRIVNVTNEPGSSYFVFHVELP